MTRKSSVTGSAPSSRSVAGSGRRQSRRARRRYLDDLNRTRLVEQADAWHRAGQLRANATALRTHGESVADDGERAQTAAWADWAIEAADRLDPLHSPAKLRAASPAEIPAEELDRYMPAGMTVRHPPDEPSW